LDCSYWAFDEGREEVNGVGVDSCTFVLGGIADGVAYVTWERVDLMGNEEGWVGLVAWWDWFGVEFVDMCDVLWSYCCN
jgi:hypothetical protein